MADDPIPAPQTPERKKKPEKRTIADDARRIGAMVAARAWLRGASWDEAERIRDRVAKEIVDEFGR